MEKEELELPKGWQEGNTVGLNFSPLVLERNKESQTAVRDLNQSYIKNYRYDYCTYTTCIS